MSQVRKTGQQPSQNAIRAVTMSPKQSPRNMQGIRPSSAPLHNAKKPPSFSPHQGKSLANAPNSVKAGANKVKQIHAKQRSSFSANR